MQRIVPDGGVRWRHDAGAAVITAAGCGELITVAGADRLRWLDAGGEPVADTAWPAEPVELAEFRTDGVIGLYLRDAAGRHSWLPHPAP